MNKKQIQKNLYDLEHNEILNKQNTLVITIATFVIGFFLGSFSVASKIVVLAGSGFFFIYVRDRYNKELDSIKQKISNLY